LATPLPLVEREDEGSHVSQFKKLESRNLG